MIIETGMIKGSKLINDIRKRIAGRTLYMLLFVLMAVAMTAGCGINRSDAGEDSFLTNITFVTPTLGLTPVPTLEPTPMPTPTPTPEPYMMVYVESEEVTSGELVLVNWEHKFIHTDEIETISIFDHKGENLLQESDDARLNEATLLALNELADRFFEHTGGDRLYVTSGYRTVEYQQNLYAEYEAANGAEMAAIYVANAGYSEHHTGYAVDLSTMSAEGERVTILNHDNSAWFNDICNDYGFILRYPIGTQEITHVAYEPWHFRYVGRPNAYAVSALGLTYEEYMEHIRQYSVDNSMLHVSRDGEIGVAFYDADRVRLYLSADEEHNDEAVVLSESPGSISDLNSSSDAESVLEGSWLIWFVPVSDGEMTEIRLPKGIESYNISGNNKDGFIVTAGL